MTTKNEIKKQKQLIALCEKTISLEKVRKRRADTRRKIELGGLVIKSGIDGFNKSIILGALAYSLQLIDQDITNKSLFENKGNLLFINKYG